MVAALGRGQCRPPGIAEFPDPVARAPRAEAATASLQVAASQRLPNKALRSLSRNALSPVYFMSDHQDPRTAVHCRRGDILTVNRYPRHREGRDHLEITEVPRRAKTSPTVSAAPRLAGASVSATIVGEQTRQKDRRLQQRRERKGPRAQAQGHPAGLPVSDRDRGRSRPRRPGPPNLGGEHPTMAHKQVKASLLLSNERSLRHCAI